MNPSRTVEASIYIPMDRRQALVRGLDLPDRAVGAALFADISGFTPLTDALVRALGPQRGAEELTRQLNLLYDALIAEVDRYGGSVVEFSGDAITCWLDADDGRRAVAAALSMQAALAPFAAVAIPPGQTVRLAMKVAVAVGPVRRFQLGDPTAQLVDVLAGATMDRLADLERLAEPGEVLLDGATATRLGDRLAVAAWREGLDGGRPAAVVSGLCAPVEPSPWPPLEPDALDEAQVRPWVVPAVYERLRDGRGDLLAELRPAASLFLRFGGIDYDADPAAGAKLDRYVRWLHGVVARYEGTLLQVTIGDKGSYVYVAFGAPVAHEDDAARAASAALELRSPPPRLGFVEGVQVGIGRGRMRAGGCGGSTCRTYAVMGNEVNLAARLMQCARPGQILVSQAAQLATGGAFAWGPPTPLTVKGRSEPVVVHELVAASERPTPRLRESRYALPMVGRADELALVEGGLAEALGGRGRVVGVTGEAGMGKSRLVAEVARLAKERGLVELSGECQSYGTNAPYLVWRPIWQALLGLDPAWPPDEQVRALERSLVAIDPGLAPRLPLLSAALNLPIPDNDLTRSFDARLRKDSAEALLVDCLRARARAGPLLLVLEDCHWLDPLSKDLLTVVGRAIADLPLLIVATYRPTLGAEAPTWLAELPGFVEIRLTELGPIEMERLVAAKLGQIFAGAVHLAPDQVARLTARAQGNPFYVEELLNYLRDRGVDPRELAATERLDLPTSLHSLILSRIDQLDESQKVTLKVASVVGRVFKAEWLWGVYPTLGESERVRGDLTALSGLDLTPLESPEPELSYIFKHVVTQEVAYESLPFATRSTLHGNLGEFVERRYGDALEQYLDLLAYHFEHSGNEAKKREYLRRAGEAAQAAYANSSAIDYFRRLLPLLAPEGQVEVLPRLGQVLETVGSWDEADDTYRLALALATRLDDRRAIAGAQRAVGGLLRRRARLAEALEWLGSARDGFERLGDAGGVSQALFELGEVRRLTGDYPAARACHEGSLALAPAGSPLGRLLRATALKGAGSVAALQGEYAAARALYGESLAILRELDDRPGIANVLNNLGIVARFQGDYAASRALHEEALTIRRQLGDRWAISFSLSNLGNVATDQADYAAARALHEEGLAIRRQLGAQQDVANSLNNLANALVAAGEYGPAGALYAEALAINARLGDRWGVAYLLEDMGCLAAAQARPERAARLVGAGAALREAISAPLSPAERAKLERRTEAARANLGEEGWADALAEGREMGTERAVEQALREESLTVG